MESRVAKFQIFTNDKNLDLFIYAQNDNINMLILEKDKI